MREPDPTSSRIGRGILESHLVRLTSSPRVQIAAEPSTTSAGATRRRRQTTVRAIGGEQVAGEHHRDRDGLRRARPCRQRDVRRVRTPRGERERHVQQHAGPAGERQEPRSRAGPPSGQCARRSPSPRRRRSGRGRSRSVGTRPRRAHGGRSWHPGHPGGASGRSSGHLPGSSPMVPDVPGDHHLGHGRGRRRIGVGSRRCWRYPDARDARVAGRPSGTSSGGTLGSCRRRRGEWPGGLLRYRPLAVDALRADRRARHRVRDLDAGGTGGGRLRAVDLRSAERRRRLGSGPASPGGSRGSAPFSGCSCCSAARRRSSHSSNRGSDGRCC